MRRLSSHFSSINIIRLHHHHHLHHILSRTLIFLHPLHHHPSCCVRSCFSLSRLWIRARRARASCAVHRRGRGLCKTAVGSPFEVFTLLCEYLLFTVSALYTTCAVARQGNLRDCSSVFLLPLRPSPHHHHHPSRCARSGLSLSQL